MRGTRQESDATQYQAILRRLDKLELHVPAVSRARTSTAVATTTGTPRSIPFDLESIVSGGYHSAVINNTRMTAPVVGVYQLGSNITWDANVTGRRILQFMLNGATATSTITMNAVSSGTTSMAVTTVLPLAAGDIVEVYVQQDSGASLNVAAAATFWMARL